MMTLTTKVYRKPTHTGLCLNFNFNHPSHVKRGLVHSCHKRASTICPKNAEIWIMTLVASDEIFS
jgi:hypothetical protein